MDTGSFGVRNKEARSDSSSLVSIQNEDRNYLWLKRISFLENVDGVYVWLPGLCVIDAKLFFTDCSIFYKQIQRCLRLFRLKQLSRKADKSPMTAGSLKTEGALVLIDPYNLSIYPNLNK